VVITGGTKGIGRACCVEMLALGANVLFCSRNQVRGLGRSIIARGIRCAEVGERQFMADRDPECFCASCAIVACVLLLVLWRCVAVRGIALFNG
jgi:NAD(P)-dependent dehydrogenase (short-subunit alcohol dehydrogenase family)